MHDRPPASLESVLAELEQVKRRVAELEAAARPARRRLQGRWVIALTLAAGSLAFAQLTVFQAGGPARASEVNGNFNQLRLWIEEKVGAVGSPDVVVTGAARIQAGSTSNAAAATGKALFVSANAATADTAILEVRNDSLTQGLALGPSTLSATGSSVNQNIHLKARGDGGVQFMSPVTFAFTRVETLVDTAGGSGWGSWSGATMCPTRQYVCGVRLRTEGNQGDGDDTALNDVEIYCCTLGN